MCIRDRYGTWVIREIESPTGFVLSEEEIAVTVGKVDEVVEIELVNYFILSLIHILPIKWAKVVSKSAVLSA